MTDIFVKTIDQALAKWCQAGREVVSVSEVTDLLLDLRAAAPEIPADSFAEKLEA